MKFAFYTLGCKTNQYETQAMEHLLLEKGHEIGSFEEACDGYVINTCSVTARFFLSATAVTEQVLMT